MTAVENGPLLLAHLTDGPGYAAHQARFGPLPKADLGSIVAAADAVAVRGRGGAGFPFAVKLQTASRAGRRTVLVVNAAEGEPASWKDSSLAQVVPHKVLDGPAVVAAALRVREVHIVTPVERPEVGASLRAAVDERRATGERLRWTFHEAQPRFVAGQARAVLELMAGRENLPVTAWQPEAVSGHRGRPTLLSNAETWAHVGALVRLGSDAYAAYGRERDNPGTTLLTLGGDGDAVVREVAAGTPWAEVLTADQLSRPVLTGGYHGTWAASGALAALTVSRSEMAAQGLALGAGVVITSARTACPVERTLRIVDYLAGESARRCGPCRNGLPALAGSLRSVVDGIGQLGRVRQLLDIVERRGACAHPDGTARLVRSLLTAVPEEVDAHLGGWCGYRAPTRPLTLAGAV